MSKTPTAEEEILSDLAHKLVDQIALYGLARDIASTPTIVDAIQRAKAARADLLQEINAKLWQHEIAAIDQGVKLGAAHKVYQRLRAVSGKDDRVAIGEVERGEDYLRERVSKVASDERLTPHTRNYLQTVLSRIETTHEEVSRLKHSLN